MDPTEIRQMIERAIPDAAVDVRDATGAGDHFEAIVVSERFKGLNPVERHQMVYKALGDALRVRIHALTLKTLTPGQDDRRQN